jgi:adenylate cyclase
MNPASPIDLHPRVDGSRCVRIHHYEVDDSVFADDVYVIKGLAGRILWLLLTLNRTTGRSTFSTRELRLHPYLKLPIWKNNLEARVLLLQRRLDARAVAFRLSREQRGQLRILCSAPLELQSILPVTRAAML